jgi:hypothetical protein
MEKSASAKFVLYPLLYFVTDLPECRKYLVFRPLSLCWVIKTSVQMAGFAGGNRVDLLAASHVVITKSNSQWNSATNFAVH